MHRFFVVLWLVLIPIGLAAQHSSSDARAVALAKQSMAALVGTQTNVTAVTLNANVTAPNGSETTNGTGRFSASGLGQSRVDLDFGGNTRSDARNLGGGFWKENGGTVTASAGHNCQTDAAWFFPALSSLSQVSNPKFVFTYIGDEEHGAVNTHHIRVYQTSAGEDGALLVRMSTEDFYLDAESGLPVAVAFKMHPDTDLLTDIDAEIRFSNYQKVSGALVPFSFQKVVNGAVVLDAAVTNVLVNSGPSVSEFDLE